MARKQWYGVTHDGYMTPCHAKNPAKCYWHVPNKHTILDENQADEYNEDWAKRQYMARRGFSTNVHENAALRKETSGEVKFETALSYEERRIRERFNDMARCGEFGEGVVPVTFIKFNVGEQGDDYMNPDVVTDRAFEMTFSFGYDPETVPSPFKIIDGSDYNDSNEFWKNQIQAVQKFLEQESHTTDAGDNQCRSIGDIFANTSYRFDYYKLDNIHHLPQTVDRGMPQEHDVFCNTMTYYPDNVEPKDNPDDGKSHSIKELYSIAFKAYIVPDDERNRNDVDEETRMLNDVRQIRHQ